MAVGGSSQLASLFTAAPSGGAQPMSYRQGKVEYWNPFTLENQVNVGGTPITNVPVLGVAEAASITVGSVVGLMIVGSTWAIIGRLVIPGTDEAEDAITRLGQQWVSEDVDAAETTTSSSYTDLGTVGPTVEINVGASGKLLVGVSSRFAMDRDAAGGLMSFAMTGTSSLSADDGRSLLLSVADGSGLYSGASLSGTRLVLLEGLDPGPRTITAKYRAVTSLGVGCTFGFRNVSCWAL